MLLRFLSGSRSFSIRHGRRSLAIRAVLDSLDLLSPTGLDGLLIGPSVVREAKACNYHAGAVMPFPAMDIDGPIVWIFEQRHSGVDLFGIDAKALSHRWVSTASRAIPPALFP